ncbi:MAG: hypothetical protein ACFE8A_04470 [Candidatus Hodarchaeota archaeon]
METIKRKNSRKWFQKKIILKTIFLFISVIIILFLFVLLNELGATSLIIVLIFLFVFVVFLGPFFIKKNKGKFKLQPHYSRIFPSKINTEVRQKENRVIDLDTKYREPSKPLILKCNKCRMILPSFVKKCPQCGKPVIE